MYFFFVCFNNFRLVGDYMLKVIVKDEYVENRSGTSKAGKPYSMNVQTNVFVELNGEVRRCEITLQDNQRPYTSGNYSLDIEQSVVMGRFGFEIDRFKPLVLQPVAVSANKAA